MTIIKRDNSSQNCRKTRHKWQRFDTNKPSNPLNHKPCDSHPESKDPLELQILTPIIT